MKFFVWTWISLEHTPMNTYWRTILFWSVSQKRFSTRERKRLSTVYSDNHGMFMEIFHKIHKHPKKNKISRSMFVVQKNMNLLAVLTSKSQTTLVLYLIWFLSNKTAFNFRRTTIFSIEFISHSKEFILMPSDSWTQYLSETKSKI